MPIPVEMTEVAPRNVAFDSGALVPIEANDGKLPDNVLMLFALCAAMQAHLATERHDAQKDPTIALTKQAFAEAAKDLPFDAQRSFWRFLAEDAKNGGFPPQLVNFFSSQANLFDQMHDLQVKIAKLTLKLEKLEKQEKIAQGVQSVGATVAAIGGVACVLGVAVCIVSGATGPLAPFVLAAGIGIGIAGLVVGVVGGLIVAGGAIADAVIKGKEAEVQGQIDGFQAQIKNDMAASVGAANSYGQFFASKANSEVQITKNQDEAFSAALKALADAAQVIS